MKNTINNTNDNIIDNVLPACDQGWFKNSLEKGRREKRRARNLTEKAKARKPKHLLASGAVRVEKPKGRPIPEVSIRIKVHQPHHVDTIRVNRELIEERVEAANRMLESALGSKGELFPWNAYKVFSAWLSYNPNYNREKAEVARKIYRDANRYCGFIGQVTAHVDELPHVVNCFSLGLSSKGINSPRTWLNFHKLIEWGNPFKLESAIKRALYRANQISRSFGIKPGYKRVLEQVVNHPGRRPSKSAKAALLAAVNQWLHHRGFPRLKSLNQAKGFYLLKTLSEKLERLSASQGHNTESYRSKLFADSEWAKIHAAAWYLGGATITEITEWTAFVDSLSWILSNREGVMGEEAIFAHKGPIAEGLWIGDSQGDYGYLAIHPELGSWHGYPNAKLAQALVEFRRRRRLMEENAVLQAALQVKDRVILAWLEDSYAAGNCAPGTENWLRRQGLQNRQVLPIRELVSRAGTNYLAINVAKEAARKAVEAGVLIAA